MAQVNFREACFGAIFRCLLQAIPDAKAERNRRSLIGQGEGTVLVLRDGGHTRRFDGAGEELFSVQAVVEGYVEGLDDTVGPDLSALYASVAAAIVAIPIPLGDGITEILIREDSLEIDPATVSESEKPIGAFYLEIGFDIRLPYGTRFLEIP